MKKKFFKICALSLCAMTIMAFCGCGAIGNLRDKIEQSRCEHEWNEGELSQEDTDVLIKTCEKCNKTQEEELPTLSVSGTLNESLQDVTGYGIMTVSEDLELTVNDGGETVLGKEGMKSVVLESDGKVSITATGGKQSVVRAVDGGTLIFRGFTFNDNTVMTSKEYNDALWVGGTLIFEDCTFTDFFRLKENVNATFKNCTFNSIRTKNYSVWVSDGTSKFENCTFKGYRGLKIHEFDGENINSVIVKQCLFENLGEKPGVTIGILDNDTVVDVRDSVFDSCVAWDTVGSLNGVDGFYECDVPLSEFTFVAIGNEIKSPKHKILYRAVINGEVVTVPTAMYKSDGVYPTLFKESNPATVSELQDVYGDIEYEFDGWYLDEALTQPFNGVVSSNKSVTLYAKVSEEAWTKNY